MEQLDLFSSGPKPETSKKKEVRKAIEPVKGKEDKGNNAGEINHNPDTTTRQSFIVPKSEPEDEPVDAVDANTKNDSVVFFEDVITPEQEEAEEKEILNTETEEEKPGKVADVAPIRTVKGKQRIPQKRGRKSFAEINAQVDLINLPDDETLFKKQYYSISEVAGWFNVNTSLLRFWETEFDVLKPRKNRKGDRMFRPEDVKNLQLIYHLLRDRKYTIDGAKDYIKGNKKKADTQLQLTQSLQKFKSFLLELKANLQ